MAFCSIGEKQLENMLKVVHEQQRRNRLPDDIIGSIFTAVYNKSKDFEQAVTYASAVPAMMHRVFGAFPDIRKSYSSHIAEISKLTKDFKDFNNVKNWLSDKGLAEQSPDISDEEQLNAPGPPSVDAIPFENSDEHTIASDNIADEIVDTSKSLGKFSFLQFFPDELVNDGGHVKIVNGAIQLKTTQGDQQRQLLRQHNILDKMSDPHPKDGINFDSVDEDGNKIFRIKMILAGDTNASKYQDFVYQTDKAANGEKSRFPFIIAMVTDRDGNPHYFNDEGYLTDKRNGMPFAFPFSVEDYKSENLPFSRRGKMLGTYEALEGGHKFLSETPLNDFNEAVKSGIPIFGDIDIVTAGRLGSINMSLGQRVQATTSPQFRTVKEMKKAGDIDNEVVYVYSTGNYYINNQDEKGGVTQQIKKGQVTLFDRRSRLSIPLKGKKVRDLTVDGKPFLTDKIKKIIETMQTKNLRTGEFTPILADNNEEREIIKNLYTFFRSLIFSQDIAFLLSDDSNSLRMVDNREQRIPLLDTEINFTRDLKIIADPLTGDEMSYADLVSENFLSGAYPVEIEKGKKKFAKLNKKIIFTLEKDHAAIIDANGGMVAAKPTIRVKASDGSRFVGKTYTKKGATSSITVASYKDGIYTIRGENGKEVTKTRDEFMQSLRSLEEVTTPPVTPEIASQFEDRVKLSKEDLEDARNKAKTMTKEDLDNLEFGCE